jgi:ParB family transcriptional regulator, chromosome partitioning protein
MAQNQGGQGGEPTRRAEASDPAEAGTASLGTCDGRPEPPPPGEGGVPRGVPVTAPDDRWRGGHPPPAAREPLQLERLPVSRVRPRPDQPRRRMDAGLLDELADSVRAHGVLQPIRVRPRDDGYEIIAGARRWRAAQEAGLEEIPAIVVSADDDRAYVEALIENIQREELNAVDRAHALQRLRVTLNLDSWQEVGELVGITRQHVYNLLNVTRLPAPIRDDVRVGDLTEKHARALLRLQGHPRQQLELWERIHRDRLSARAVDDAAREILVQMETRPREAEAETEGDLPSLIDGVVAALMTAAPGEVSAAHARLDALHRLVTDLLARPAP